MPARRIVYLCMVVFASCQILGEAGTETMLTGIWGGQHASLDARLTGATLEFDCAFGKIEGEIAVDEKGRFNVDGGYTPGGGPVIERDSTNTRPAVYDGVIRGSSMTLSVILTDSGTELGPFLLERGGEARVYKCL